MNQMIFYNLEKNVDSKMIRLSASGNCTYDDVLAACQEFVTQLQTDLAQRIAEKELADKKAAESAAPTDSITPEVVG